MADAEIGAGGGRPRADVCVIGAGLAGLAAADRLLRAGLSVELLEAQPQPGGRIRDLTRGGAPVELGANWFSRSQPLIAEQIERFGLETIATHDEGDHLLSWGRGPKAFRGSIPPLGLLQLVDLARGLARFERIAARLQGVETWGNDRLAAYDHQSFGQWIDGNLRTAAGRDFFRLTSEMVFGVEPYLVSFLYALHYASRSDSLTSLISVRRGHQEMRFRNGPGELCDRLAEHVGASRLQLGTPVRSVRLGGGSAEVETARGRARYRAVLCAVPPHAARRIAFSPGLPPARNRLLQALPMGRVIKVQAIYARPYWRELGLSGQAMSNGYPLTYTIDNSPADAGCGVLAGFVCSSRAERFLAERDPQAAAARAIDALFEGRLPAPAEVVIEDWAANPWIGGSYGAYCPPGVMTRLGGAVRDHGPPLYWCGAEYARVHPCQMEGALESGRRAARDIAADLSAERPPVVIAARRKQGAEPCSS
jgi:monoamine oxidase